MSVSTVLHDFANIDGVIVAHLDANEKTTISAYDPPLTYDVTRPSIIDLFAGLGGFSIGNHLLGGFPALAVERDQWVATLRDGVMQNLYFDNTLSVTQAVDGPCHTTKISRRHLSTNF